MDKITNVDKLLDILYYIIIYKNFYNEFIIILENNYYVKILNWAYHKKLKKRVNAYNHTNVPI